MSTPESEGQQPSNRFSPEEKQRLIDLQNQVAGGGRSEFLGQWGTSPIPNLQDEADEDFSEFFPENDDLREEPSPSWTRICIDDFSNEPLPTPEQERGREMYQSFMQILPNFGFTEHGGSGLHSQISAFGMQGSLKIEIGINADHEEDGNNHHTITEKSKYLNIRGSSVEADKKGNRRPFHYLLFNNGLVKEGIFGYRIPFASRDSAVPQEFLDEMHEDLSPWLEAMSNLDYSPEKIREQILAIRASLIDHFTAQDIVPKMDDHIYDYQPSEEITQLCKMCGADDIQEDPAVYIVPVGREYPIGTIPGMDGEWVVQYETDVDFIDFRAKGNIYEQEVVHGQGLIISDLNSGKMYKDPLKKRSHHFAFWENGDVHTPGGEIGMNWINGVGNKQIRNPHQALIDAYRLQHALTGSSLPEELVPPPPPLEPSRARRWLNKIFNS